MIKQNKADGSFLLIKISDRKQSCCNSDTLQQWMMGVDWAASPLKVKGQTPLESLQRIFYTFTSLFEGCLFTGGHHSPHERREEAMKVLISRLQLRLRAVGLTSCSRVSVSSWKGAEHKSHHRNSMYHLSSLSGINSILRRVSASQIFFILPFWWKAQFYSVYLNVIKITACLSLHGCNNRFF